MARNRAGNLAPQGVRRSFAPTRTLTLRGKDGGSTISVQLPQALSRGQIPIEPVAPPLLHFPRFRALALFGRQPHEHVVCTSMPASENLHRNGLMQCNKRHARAAMIYSITSSAPGALPAGQKCRLAAHTLMT